MAAFAKFYRLWCGETSGGGCAAFLKTSNTLTVTAFTGTQYLSVLQPVLHLGICNQTADEVVFTSHKLGTLDASQTTVMYYATLSPFGPGKKNGIHANKWKIHLWENPLMRSAVQTAPETILCISLHRTTKAVL